MQRASVESLPRRIRMKTHFLRTRSIVPLMIGAWTALVGLLLVNPAHAQDVRLQDLLQSEFERPFTITGWGLVTGLQGSRSLLAQPRVGKMVVSN